MSIVLVQHRNNNIDNKCNNINDNNDYWYINDYLQIIIMINFIYTCRYDNCHGTIVKYCNNASNCLDKLLTLLQYNMLK